MFPYKKIRSHELVFKKSENLTRVKRSGFRTFKNSQFCGFPGLWTSHKYKNIADGVTAVLWNYPELFQAILDNDGEQTG